MTTIAAETSTMHRDLMTGPATHHAGVSSARVDATTPRRLDAAGIAGVIATAILLIAMLPGMARTGSGANAGAPVPLAAPALVVGG